MKYLIYLFVCIYLFISNSSSANENKIVLIAHENVPEINKEILNKVYLGKLNSVKEINLVPVNSKAGSFERTTFLKEFLHQDDERYIGYWNVRRYIGKGSPPIEINTSEDIIHFVENNAGAIAYVGEEVISTNKNNNLKIKFLFIQ